MNDTTTTPTPALAEGEARPRRRWMTVGFVAASLSLAGSSVAVAAGLGSGSDGAQPGGETVISEEIAAEQSASTLEDDRSAASEAFWAAGYSTTDVARLGDLWQLEDTFEVKARAGQLILDGKQAELGAPTPEVEDPAITATTAFWDAGYTYEDAEELAALWSSEDTYEAKIAAGEKLLAGEVLPVLPSGQPGVGQ
ncbi:hypothetical protein QUV83_10595 [Cellulomonas cellasea]|uniref:hypothetical protein n=1 Tax=Cellulomonas cellasea TaxID=43670 RepID=UPI0025A3AB05|nr:hypothetical protein [Cellulomonas cellasea]MDM8085212.1 hypothetical protein [Cellulomonas cellasea]